MARDDALRSGSRIEGRFWPKVDVRGPNDCWEWIAGRSTGGYGMFGLGGGHNDRAHRVAWTLAMGPIPAGKWVLHHCDNRPCCNPRHLYIGNRADNIRDMVDRGRQRGAEGERNRHSKLTPEQVAEIRAVAPSDGFRWGEQAALAKRYGVTPLTIYHIVSGKTWKGS